MTKGSHPPKGGSKGKPSSGPPKEPTKSEGGKNAKGKSQESKDDPKGKGKQTDKPGQKGKVGEASEEPPKRPDTRTLIAGASWTGKLPVNLLSELCQKQKWEKPDYSIYRISEGFVGGVTLASKNAKTGDMTTLPRFEIPKTVRPSIAEPTAVEARHFAAAYTLFRIASMKNMHMTLPPKYKDFWKGLFTELKVEDVKLGNVWMYDSDPFATARNREEEERIRIKKREEAERQKAKQAETSIMGLSTGRSRAWDEAPKMDLGKNVRFEMESLIRRTTVWNPNSITIPKAIRNALVDEISKLGFRKSHVEEAADICKDKEEVLEWLLTHVPEDDLPKWSLPENYVAGVSLATSDLKRDAVIERLAAAGYAPDLCEEQLDLYNGDEKFAAQALQTILLQSGPIMAAEFVEDSESEAVWDEEAQMLISMFDDRYTHVSKDTGRVALAVNGSTETVTVQMQRPIENYPHAIPILRIIGKLPAYMRLSITKQALIQCQQFYIGEPMIFNLVDWLEQNIAAILMNPGKLSEVSSASLAVDPKTTQRPHKPARVLRSINWNTSNPAARVLLDRWTGKQSNSRYQKMKSTRQTLPAWEMQEAIINAVENHPVTIISGETGSGKSTQSVQFVLDNLIQRNLGGAANIICTQPRRISAIGLADRVAEERDESVGSEVGYIIRGESRVKHGTTKITFMTTGVLLRRLQTSGASEDDLAASLSDVSHVFIDEVHERAIDADFLLVLLKRILKKRKDLKVVLMSATIDAEAFERYFSSLGRIGRVHIRGRTFPVTDYYKDDIIRFTGHNMDNYDDEAEPDEKIVSAALRSSGMRTDYELIAKIVEYIDAQLGSSDGGILIFLPGAMEIDRTIQAIRRNSKFYALPLHASLPPAEQKRVFPPPPRGFRKVIAATNVAETSITIPDVVAVIDTGRVKETTFDTVTSAQKLSETWASRAACAQRRGRAGRVRAGICYKLYTRNVEAKMRERPDPEILRVPLEQLCLSVKAMGIADVSAFLASALTPPSSPAVDTALKLLSHVGAIDLESGELTALGKHLSLIPADLRCAKLLVFGCTFGSIDPCLTIAALLSSRSPFLNPKDKRDEVKQVRFAFAPGQGDLLVDLRAFEGWIDRRKTCSSRDLRNWVDDNFLSNPTLREIESNRTQLASALEDIGFLPFRYLHGSASQEQAKSLNVNSSNDALLRALISAAMHPQTLRISFPAKKFAASASGSVALDPESRTIRFFDTNNSRAFIHPSSVCFEAPKGWSSDARFLSYWERTITGDRKDNERSYIRGCTPFNLFSVLLFGGRLNVDTFGRGVMVDEWIRARGWARIGVLVGRMRALLDRVLERKVHDPFGKLTVDEEKVLALVKRLVERDGLDR
jgi:ATP-dependent RNA helicase DHX57